MEEVAGSIPVGSTARCEWWYQRLMAREAPILAGDVGGTKTLLRLVSPSGETLHQARFESPRFVDLSVIVEEFLRAAPSVGRPKIAAFGVAGPVVGGQSRTTNLPWQLEEGVLAERCGIERVLLLNDFEATALGVLSLPKNMFLTLQEGHPQPKGAIGVIGAGTGLGEALLFWSDGDYRVVATEGGHADFAPRDEREIELLRFLRKRFGRVSWERVVSGQGINNIYEFLRDSGAMKESAAIAAELALEDHGAVIGRHALAGDDALCLATIDMFVASYGAEAGNLALKGLTTGGVYLTGGIAPKLLPKLQEGSFLRSYRDKGRLSLVVEKAPVHVVLDQEVALKGAALAARRAS
jgi:glucokinase